MPEIKARTVVLPDGSHMRAAVERTGPRTATLAQKQGGVFDLRKRTVSIWHASGLGYDRGLPDYALDTDIGFATASGPEFVDARTARGALRLARQGRTKQAA